MASLPQIQKGMVVQMLLLTSDGIDSIVQLITVIFIFIFVLALTYLSTVFLARMQSGQQANQNIAVIETFKITQNKFIQIIRVGEKYFAIAVCKDTITLLGEVSQEEITVLAKGNESTMSFMEIFNKAKNSIHKK